MKKVLIIDDDDSLRQAISVKLHSEGFETIEAKHGLEGLGMAVHEKPDLIILDVIMPYISGKDILQLLKCKLDTQHIPVIMFTNLEEMLHYDNAIVLPKTDTSLAQLVVMIKKLTNGRT